MDWKKIVRKLLFPPVWLMILLAVLSVGGLTAVFVNGWETAAVSYGVYVMSFYTLCVVTAFCIAVLPGRYKRIRKKVLDNPLGNRLVTDRVFRTKVSLKASFMINLLYAAVNVFSWYLYQSWWFVCLAVYYGILFVMRFLLTRYTHIHEIGKNRCGELKRARICSYIMLLLNFFLTGAVMMVVFQNRGYTYHGILIYVMALFTFFTAAHAIIELIRYRKLESPVMSAAKVISVAAALVSMLNLETAMFAEFGADMAKEVQGLMIMLTGAGISITVIVLAVSMIVRCTKELKRMRCEKNG